jgi:hypothetical protein
MSLQNIPLKIRADFRRFSRIWQSETIRAPRNPGIEPTRRLKCHCETSREDSNRSVSTIFGNSGRCRGHVRSGSSIRTLRKCSPNSRFVPIATERSAAKSVVIRSPRRPARAACVRHLKAERPGGRARLRPSATAPRVASSRPCPVPIRSCDDRRHPMRLRCRCTIPMW